MTREELVRRRPQHIHEQCRADERNDDDDQAEDDRANVMWTAVGGSREVGCARRSLAKAAGLVASLGYRLQTVGLHLPTEFFAALPYAMTVIALWVASASWASRRLGTPAALGVPYSREEG